MGLFSGTDYRTWFTEETESTFTFNYTHPDKPKLEVRATFDDYVVLGTAYFTASEDGEWIPIDPETFIEEEDLQIIRKDVSQMYSSIKKQKRKKNKN